MTDSEYQKYLDAHKRYNRAYREKHREELNAKRREYYQRNRAAEIDRGKLYYRKQKAKMCQILQ